MNNDELQKAIDDITRDNAAPAAGGATENEALADEIAGPTTREGVNLAPTNVAEFNVPAAPAPAVPETPGMPPVAEAPVTDSVSEAIEAATANVGAMPVAEPAPETTPVAEAPVATPEVKPVGNEEVKKEALKELYPLLDKVQMEPKEKFDIAIEYGEPAKALEYAKVITDETEKANALLEVINKVK